MIFFIFCFLLTLILTLVWFIFGKNHNKNIEKSSRFECGFDPIKKARVVFSLRFFLVIIIFLIFEIEIILLIPLVLTKLVINYFSFWIILFILSILLIGLIHEWNQGCLNWIQKKKVIYY